MKCVELNPKGNFECWEPGKLEELTELAPIEESHDHVVFENETVKLRIIDLEPYERVPFQRINHDFSITCLSEGLAITRYSDGRIALLRFNKGDTSYHAMEDMETINDLQNIGENSLKITILEQKCHGKNTHSKKP